MSTSADSSQSERSLTQENIAYLVGFVKRLDGHGHGSEWATVMHTDTGKLGHHRRVLEEEGLIEFTGEEVPAPDAPDHVTTKVYRVTDDGEQVADEHADDVELPMPPEVMANEIRRLRERVEENEREIESVESKLQTRMNDLIDEVKSLVGGS